MGRLDGVEGLDLPESVVDALRDSLKTGSRWMCEPPVEDSDDDRLLFVDDRPAAVEQLQAEGWEVGGSLSNGGTFTSVTRAGVNLIVTDSEVFAERFELATDFATQCNLREKKDRIALFRVVLYGERPEDACATCGGTGRIPWPIAGGSDPCECQGVGADVFLDF